MPVAIRFATRGSIERASPARSGALAVPLHGKDAGLILELYANLMSQRLAAPRESRCGQSARPGGGQPRCSPWSVRSPRRTAALLLALVLSGAGLLPAGGTFFSVAHAQEAALYLPRPAESEAITISAERVSQWRQGAYDVWLLDGNCRLSQGAAEVSGPAAVIWIDNAAGERPGEPAKVIAYFEASGSERVRQIHAPPAPAGEGAANTATAAGDPSPKIIPIPAESTGRIESPSWFGRLVTQSRIELQFPTPGAEPAEKPAIVSRGLAHFGLPASLAAAALGSEPPEPARLSTRIDPAVEPAQFAPGGVYSQAVPSPGTGAGPRASFRRVQIRARSDGPGTSLKTVPLPSGENALTYSGGINVVVQGITFEELPEEFGPIGDVDLEADRVVIWGLDPGSIGQSQASDNPLEIYMEGNIVFRQGDRIVYADRMFYDVRRRMGVILNAELLTPLPPVAGRQYPGLVRLRAASLRQLDHSRFVAQDALLTTSRLEEPSYHFASELITFQESLQPGIDPVTGAPAAASERMAQAQNNFVYVAGVPVFYWPTIATNLEAPSYFIDNVRIRNDSIFGFQTLLDLDAFQLFGIDAPAGVDWTLDVDYLSRRGLGLGTGVEYERDSFFQLVGPTTGRLDLWGIRDTGLDNLGRERRAITPEEEFRGRAFWNHRQRVVGGLLDDWTVQAEVGWLSDRTFLEQYYENEWEENKDQVTGLRLKRTLDNQSFSIEANARVNGFFTQTQWLPRLDHYWLGQPLLGNRLTWFEHSQAAFANIGIASTPTNPTLAGQFERFPWEVDSAGVPISGKGERLVTRQELDLPLNLAPFKVVPYGLFELGHWGQDINGDDIQRIYGQTGIRASIPFWAVDPTVRDALFNLNGLAHKIVFEGEVSYADANRNLDQFPQYDELDDDSIEEFRRRLFFSPFGGELAGRYYLPGAPSLIDPKFDPRVYALRSGLQGWVTSPATEIADDLMLVRAGMRHRLQTKRGPAGGERIIDWLTFDTNATWFPREDRDNFGQGIGLVDYDLRWHLGDRFTILSDGAADFFGDGLRTAAIGMLLNRPEMGNAYLGFRTLDGPFEANVITATVNYRMSAKWIGSASASVDLGEAGNIGQSFSVSRIGETLIATLGAHVDESKDNVGVSFLVEPRFLPSLSSTRRTGIEVPPAGAYTLE